MSMRAFLAVDICASSKLRSLLSELQKLGRTVKTVDSESLHVTLKFLGNINESFVPRATAVLDEAVRGKREKEIQLRGLGAFPHAGRPSVVWVGLKNSEFLVEIADRLEEQFSSLGIQAEKRAFQPHLTVARVKAKPPGELRSLIEAGIESEFGEMRISSIQLCQSELLPAGPRYTVLHEAILKGERDERGSSVSEESQIT